MSKRSRIAAALLVLCLLMGCSGETPLATVPDVTETDAEVAVAVLTQQGLVPVVKETVDQTAAVGTVVSTDPPAGSAVAVGGKVYLFVAADTATSTSLSSTSQPLSTTVMPQSSTSATQTSTSPHTSATIDTTTTTTAHPCAAGHRFSEGICGVCGKPDPDFVPTLSLGQTWTVEGQWSLTILGVTEHSLCNPVQSTIGQRVVTIRYTYENHGFVSDSEPFLFDATTFTITEESGAAALPYGCFHKEKAILCAVGESHTAEETYAAAESCRRVTLLVTLHTSDKRRIEKIQFDIPLP